MDRLLRKGSLVLFIALITAHPVLSVEAVSRPGSALTAPSSSVAVVEQGRRSDPVARELSGFLEDKRDQYRAARRAQAEAGLAEDGTPAMRSPLADLPVIDDKLASKAMVTKADEILRVIVHLDYLPHAAVLQDTLARHKSEVEGLENDRQAILGRLKAKRDTSGAIDALNYSQTRGHEASEREALRSLHERNEVLGGLIKTETTQVLRQLIDADQAPVIEAIEKLGGTIEFTMIAGNTLVATLPAAAISQLASVEGIMRVVEDSIMDGHLNVADTSTMVDPADASLVGLWDNNQDGGIYDPAVIDTGTDLAHPALANNGTRTNWCSWYLVAANGSANFDDTFSCDDSHGHGTANYGILGSYGSPVYPDHLGMAYGVEKVVSLKAGWRNTSGSASMFWSDKYNLVERALNNTAGLGGPVAYADDVEGFNLSFGGATTLDDTDGGRFWDSVISSHSDIVTTITVGNSGPNNANFQDPAVSYNAIAVGYFDDQNTTSRDDDTIGSASSAGPTASNRRKPDLVAPGASISSPNYAWETQADFVNQSGASYAAPMVLGVLMDLMDAAVFDEKALKALLINSAQKNLPGMDFESDTDGWDPRMGWGAINAYAAYFHRFDLFQDSVTPNGNPDDFQLYKGSMQDEGSANGGEGRDRATMVWNRVATYNPAAAPTTYYSLVDLNLRLYQESNEFLIDSDLDFNDNVHQVRIGSGAPATDVIINAYAWSSNFLHGLANQQFALATEDGFARVDFPTTFQGIAIWPSSVEPNEVFDITFWLRNDSEIASHDNVFNLELPAGWTLISGIDTQNVGSAAAAGGITAQVSYTLRAPSSAVGATAVTIKHSHNSYNEPYGDFNWNINLTVEFDNTPPNPNPMSFSTLPFNVSTDSMSMTASFASDIHGPVEYYLDYTSSPSGGTGGSDSGWQSSRSYTDLLLTANDEYCYRSWARDNAVFPNLTTPSPIECAYTSQATPDGVTFGTVTTISIQAASSSLPNNLTLGLSGLQIQNTTEGTNSGWQQNNNLWTSEGLTPATGYTFAAQARNGDGDQTSLSPSQVKYTLPNIPAVNSLTTTSGSAITVEVNPNGNGSEAEYFIENTTAGTNSGWINDTTWVSSGLSCETFHSFQGRARNGDGIETIIVPLGIQTTGLCVDSDGDGITDDVDNCTDVFNPDQYDSNGDNIGNLCDADIDGPDGGDDCVVNFVDLAAMGDSFFANPASPNWNPHADFDDSGLINFADLAILQGQFFGPPGPSAEGCN